MSARIRINNRIEFANHRLQPKDGVFIIENFHFLEDFTLESSSRGVAQVYALGTKVNGYIFKNCRFTNIITQFENGSFSPSLVFEENCEFDELNFEDSIFLNPVKFFDCKFHGRVNFNNTTFEKLADFFNSEFFHPLIFYKTNFKENAVFSAVKFHENVLFTYTKIDGVAIFRASNFLKGLDLSLAIINNKISVYGLNLQDFKVISKKLNATEVENYVRDEGQIPIKNKKETFRILKNQLKSENNNISALNYHYREQVTLRKDMFSQIFRKFQLEKFNFKSIKKSLLNRFRAFTTYLLLLLNRFSNNHGLSYERAFFFTVIVSTFFFSLSLAGTSEYEWSWTPNLWENIPNYVKFFNPTHNYNYLLVDNPSILLTESFYLFDFLGRLFVGYGIYQFVQAFRKFK